jgi:hypothetical protein
VGRVYQQTAIDTYSKVAFAKLYDRKTPLTAADLMNDRVVPFLDEHEIVVNRSRNSCIVSVSAYGMTRAKALSVPGSTAAKM